MIRDSGISGNGSLYGSRFKAGDVISASQLNDLNSGLMQGTVQPYLGAGVITSYGAGGTQVLYNPDYIPSSAGIQQFEISLFSEPQTPPDTGVDWFIQIGKGRVYAGYTTGNIDNGAGSKMDDTWVALGTFYVEKVAVCPTGSLDDGTDDTSPYVNGGGKIKLPAASIGETVLPVEVCLIRNPYPKIDGSLPANCNQCFPYLAVIQIGSDADTKTYPFAYQYPDNYLEYIQTLLGANQNITVYEPSGGGGYEPVGYNIPTLANVPDDSEAHLLNYNCQRVPIALLIWDSVKGVWSFNQIAIGTLAMPLNITCKQVNVVTTPYTTTAQNASNQDAWYSSYTGSDIFYDGATNRTTQ